MSFEESKKQFEMACAELEAINKKYSDTDVHLFTLASFGSTKEEFEKASTYVYASTGEGQLTEMVRAACEDIEIFKFAVIDATLKNIS